MIDSIGSISPPFDAAILVSTVMDDVGITMFPSPSTTLPEKEKLLGPLPSLPSVMT